GNRQPRLRGPAHDGQAVRPCTHVDHAPAPGRREGPQAVPAGRVNQPGGPATGRPYSWSLTMKVFDNYETRDYHNEQNQGKRGTMTINEQPTADEIRERDAAIHEMFTYLDNNHVGLDEYGCFVAVTEDKTTLFWCPMLVDGSPERCEYDPRHMDWGEVTAPM